MSEASSATSPSTRREPPYDQDEDEINLVELLWVVVKNRWRIARAMLIAGVLVAGFTLTMKNVYESKVTLLPVSGSDNGGALGGGALTSLLPFGRKTTDPFQAVLNSQGLKSALVDEFELRGVYFPELWDQEQHAWIDPDPQGNPTQNAILAKFAKQFLVSTDSDTGLVTIAIQDETPELAAQIANRIPQLLEKMLTEMTLTTSKRQRVFVERQIEIVAQSLKDIQERLVNFSPGRGDMAGAMSGDGIVGLADATVALSSDTARWLAASSDLLKQIAAVEMEIGLKAGQGVSDLDGLKSRRDALRLQLDRASQQEAGSQQGGTLTTVPVARLPVVAMEYLRLNQELFVQQELYKLLRQQLELSRIGEIKEAVAFQLVDSAVPSDQRDKVKPKRTLIVLGSMAVVGFFAVVWIFVREGGRKVDAETGEMLARIRHDLAPKTVWREVVPGMLGRLPEETLPSLQANSGEGDPGASHR